MVTDPDKSDNCFKIAQLTTICYKKPLISLLILELLLFSKKIKYNEKNNDHLLTNKVFVFN